jgi:hypothetical protein
MSRRDFAGPVKKVFSRHLDSRGDGTGVTAATGLYANSVVTFDNTSNVVTLASHGFVAGDGPFTFTTTGSLPAELALLTDYYVGPTVNAGSFEVSLTRGGAVVPFTDDGSATTTLNNPFRFYIEAQAGEILRVARMIVHIEDAITWNAAEYGNLGAALTNGVSVTVEDTDGNTINTLTDITVKSNADWGRYCFDNAYVAYGAGNDFLSARWTFDKAGSPIRLKLGEKFVVTVNDDLDGLDAHTFVVQGIDEGQWTHNRTY